MNSRIRELKNRLKYKEAELVSAKNKATRKAAEYNVVRCAPRLGWYGKNQCQKANRDCEFIIIGKKTPTSKVRDELPPLKNGK